MLAHHHSLQVRSPLKIEIKTNKYIAQRKQTMKIVFLDSKTIGDDIDLSEYDKLGEVVKYDFSTTEEAAERARDADVIVLNKVEVNEKSIGQAKNLKLVCVTATGTNNLDKEYLEKSYVDKAWDYSIQDKYVDEDSKKSPYCILIGERRLIYNLLLKIEENNQDAKKMAPWLYLYLLIKNRIRMEHYLANDLVGLSNYNLTVRNSNSPMTEAMRMLFDKFQEDNSIMEVRMNEKGCDEFLKEREQTKWIKAILLISKSFRIEESKSIVAKYIKPLQKGKIAGVDFAGLDTEKRPRDFEDIIKYLRDKGIDNLTYHIGENFYDLVDGLRAIDEIMTDLNWQKPNRLAHLLALFTNADKYYERKHYTVTMPRKMLLDNLEWIRKNAPEGVDTNDFVLPHDIQNDEDIVVFKLNKTIVEVVKYNQDRIRTEIIRRGIPIETCPTSNLRIGYFSKYSELPTCSLLCDEESVVTINTDAPGILNTSLENEYNLIALALKKDKGKSESDIKKAVEKLKQNAKAAMFG